MILFGFIAGMIVGAGFGVITFGLIAMAAENNRRLDREAAEHGL